MENQPAQSKNVMLTYGLMLGIVSIIISVIYYAMGLHYEQDWKRNVIGIAVSVIIIYLGIKKFKELNNGYLTLGQALKTGIGISVISGLISVIYTFLFMYVIEPEFVNNLAEITRQNMYETNPELTEEQMDQAISVVKTMSSPGIFSAIILVFSLFFGFIISLILGLILKNNPENV